MEETVLDSQDQAKPILLSSDINQCVVEAAGNHVFSEVGLIMDRLKSQACSPAMRILQSSPPAKSYFNASLSEWPVITNVASQAYCEESEARRLQLATTGERTTNSAIDIMKWGQVSYFPSPLLQVHNRSADSSGPIESTPWKQWTSTELNSNHQYKDDHLSELSPPSLSSSGVSSVRTNAEETCLTPDAFTRTSRLPCIRKTARQYDLYNESVPESGQLVSVDSDYETSPTTSEGDPNRQTTEWSRIAGPHRISVDWAHWDPSKFQCRFCKERFLVEVDLRTHLRTHKRHRMYLKGQRKHKKMDSWEGSSLDISSQAESHLSIARHKYQPEEQDLLVDVVCPENARIQGTSARAIHLCDHSTDSDSGDEKVARFTSNRTTVPGDRISTTLNETSNLHILGFRNLAITNHNSASTRGASFHPGRHTMRSGVANNHMDYPISKDRVSSECPKSEKTTGDCSHLNESLDVPIFDLEMDAIQQTIYDEKLLMVKSFVSSIKQKLGNCMMAEFLVISKESWALSMRSRGATSESTPRDEQHSEPGASSSKVSSNTRGLQFNRENNGRKDPDDGEGDDDERRAPKRPRTSSSPSRILKDTTKFACPYRKYDPRKYCVQNWRPCALTPLDSVARVKAHLYRHHRIFQCQRCKCLFLNQNVLEEHILALEGCEPNRVNLAEGITVEIEKRLRSRKKSYPHQTEPERWNEIYQVLFPTAILPSPFFEPVEESVDQPTDSAKLADFEAYTQRELPKMFWAALEEVVANEMQPVEERLKSQLMDMIRDCQDRVFSTYQSMATSAIDNLLRDNLTKDTLLDPFEPLSRTTSAESHHSSSASLLAQSVTQVSNETTGSGCSGNLSAFNSSTTLSSIFDSSTRRSSVFNSSTTLSSIASSQIPSAIQSTNKKLPSNTDEITTCNFDANDEMESTTGLLPNDFWATDVNGAVLSQYDIDGMWNTGSDI